MNKKVLFLTGTRADFGKLKTLISAVEQSSSMEPLLFVTGMHMLSKYGMTSVEVESCFDINNYKFINQNEHDSMDVVLSKTIKGLSDYVKEMRPDLIVVHGDRVEAMAGAIVGSLNNILVAHIEGGEVSGTIDELIRHAVSKMAHIHFVSNDTAKLRLRQLGESDDSIHVIGSPDLDIMNSDNLPEINDVRERYDIDFNEYAVLMYHPVTTELDCIERNFGEVVKAVSKSQQNFVIVYPNNDHGSELILKQLELLKDLENIKLFPSLRFEYFLVLLKHASYIIGNSSAGIREAPFYGVPTINVGTRQNGRSQVPSIINVDDSFEDIYKAICEVPNHIRERHVEFGEGNSDQLFIEALQSESFWDTNRQKVFQDLAI